MSRSFKIVIALVGAFIIASLVSNRFFVEDTPRVNLPYIVSIPSDVKTAVIAFGIAHILTHSSPTPTPGFVAGGVQPTFILPSGLSPTMQTHPTNAPIPTSKTFTPTPVKNPTLTSAPPTPTPTVKIPKATKTPTPKPTSPPNTSCPSTSSEQYGQRGLNPPDLNADHNPDTVMSLRGWTPSNGTLGLVTYGYPPDAPPDPNAPQLGTIANNGASFSSLYRVLPDQKDDSLAGLTTQPGQTVYAPSNGYNIGAGYQYLVVYASNNELTINVTGDDQAIDGYALHFYGFCVDPNLVSLYRQLDGGGRISLPALHGQQKIGTANAGEIKVAIRDSGTFMDPRSKLDWWKGY